MIGDLANLGAKALKDKFGKKTKFIPHTSLDDFLTRFTSSAGYYANQIDTLNTFDVQIQFYPNKASSENKKDFISGALKTLKKAGTNALDNVTGGLFSQIANGDNDALSLRTNMNENESFVKYILKSTHIFDEVVDDEENIILQLGLYIQEMTLPQLKTLGGGKVDNNYLGSNPYAGNVIVPDNNTIQMGILNTKLPLIEYIFYPWLKETTLPYWSYKTKPYTTATIKVDFSKHNNIQYIFTGCRPSNIQMIQPSQEPDGETARQVTFDFDYMFVYSDMKIIDSVLDTALGVAGSIGSAVGGVLGIG